MSNFTEAKKIVDQTMKQTEKQAASLKHPVARSARLASRLAKAETRRTGDGFFKPKPSDDSNPENSIYEVGYVISTRNYLLLLNGLPTVRINEIVVNEDGVRGLVTGLNANSVEVLLLDDARIEPNEQFFKTGQQLAVGVGDHLLSRVINPLGVPIDGKAKFPKPKDMLPVSKVASGLKSRQFIKEQFLTGLTTVDMLIPIAKGQRELIIGSARSGKSSFLIDVIVNQSSTETIVIFALIGKPLTEIRRIVDTLAVNKAIDRTCIIAASSSDPASLILVTPAVAFTIAEFFQTQGKDVLLVLDDLGLHAKYYREIALLSSKAPGRESYPGDIFSIHAALVERAGKFNPEYGGGSITALPVIETSFNDYASFIPTNLMAMTDGHLMFDYELYHKGLRPALNIPLSVSRVGRQTQNIVEKQLADHVKSTLAQAKRLESLSRFGSEVSEQTQQLLNQGKQIEVLLSQQGLTHIPHPVQTILLSLVFTPFLTSQNEIFVKENKQKMVDYLAKNINLEDFQQKTNTMKNEPELISLVTTLIPELEKACGNTQS